MNLSDLGNLVAKYSPELGSLIPLPGRMGEAALKMVAKAFGADVDPQSIAWAIEKDPLADLKLIALQNNLQLGMRQADVEDYKTEVEDRKRASNQYVALNQAGNPAETKPDKTARNIAYMVVIAFIAATFAIPFLPIDSREVQIMLIFAGMLASKFNSIIDFFFGSSKLSDAMMTMFSNVSAKKKIKSKLDLPEPKFNGT